MALSISVASVAYATCEADCAGDCATNCAGYSDLTDYMNCMNGCFLACEELCKIPVSSDGIGGE